RNHVPRRTILHEIANSEEGRQKRVALAVDTRAAVQTGYRPPSLIARWRGRMMASARQLVRKVLLSRFDSIDYKLSFVLEEIATRSEGLSRKSDEALWTISQKLDDYVSSV